MAYTTIPKSTDYFNTKLYTGNAGTQTITGVDFQPDWTWIKERGGANDHKLTDSSRGVTKSVESNTDIAEATEAQGVKAFTSTGITLGTDVALSLIAGVRNPNHITKLNRCNRRVPGTGFFRVQDRSCLEG